MASGPGQPYGDGEYPSPENSRPPPNPYSPVDYPADTGLPPPVYGSGYPGAGGYPYGGHPYAADPYAADPYAADPYDPYRPVKPYGTNGKAIGSLATAIVGLLLCFCFIPSIVGLILGIIAMNETKSTGQDGRGLAVAGVVIAALSLALGVVFIIIGVVSDSGNPYDYGTF